jgi:hypothetical protein
MEDIATLGVTRSRLGVSLPLLAGLFGYGLTLAFGSGALGDPDIMWHIVTGRWILAHGAVPHHDLYSFSMPHAAWVAHEWLAEPLMAWLYDHLGWHGLVLMAAVGNAATVALFCRVLLRYVEPPIAIILIVLNWLVLLQHTLARPHILALPLMIAWVGALVAARVENRAPPLLLALIMVPWVNLHGSFLFGLLLACLFAGEAFVLATGVAGRWAAVKAWSPFIAIAALATLVTPNGIEAWLLPFRLLDMKFTLSLLSEWQSVNFQSITGLEIWLLGGIAAALRLGLRLPLTRAAMVLLLLHMALQHARHGELLAFVAPLIAAPAIGAQLRSLGERQARASSGLDRALQSMTAPATGSGIAIGAAFLVAAGALAFVAPVAPDKHHLPDAAIAAALAHFADEHQQAGPVLNDYAFGGDLIFRGIPTFIDGRADMFGDAFIKRDHDAVALRSDELPRLLDDYHIGWTLLPPKTPGLTLLDTLPGWQRIYADDIAVVHVRRAAGDTPPATPAGTLSSPATHG